MSHFGSSWFVTKVACHRCALLFVTVYANGQLTPRFVWLPELNNSPRTNTRVTFGVLPFLRIARHQHQRHGDSRADHDRQPDAAGAGRIPLLKRVEGDARR